MIFDRVICGIDGSDASLDAARRAAAVAQGTLTLLAALDPWDEVLANPSDADKRSRDPRAERESDLARAVTELSGDTRVEPRFVEDRPQQALIDEAIRIGATLIVVGSHGHGRIAGLVLGSVASGLVHAAPCSVLVTRPTTDPRTFPTTAVVGIDGSSESALALEAAQTLQTMRATNISVVVASDGADPEAILRIVGSRETTALPGDAVTVLTEEADNVDLLIVGSRGLKGLSSLGSVSERIVHRAACSVLVVRQQP